jgi:hypothetical protein
LKNKPKNGLPPSATSPVYVAENHPQAAHAGLQKSLQAEWQFLQRVTEGIDVKCSGNEQELRTKILPALFSKESLTDSQRQLTCIPVKKAGIAIAAPTESAGGNYTASMVACGHLISALRGKEPINHGGREGCDTEKKSGDKHGQNGS